MVLQGVLKRFQSVSISYVRNGRVPQIVHQIALTSKDSYTLPSHIREIRIKSGKAWVSHQTQDTILCWGQRMRFPKERGTVVLTGLENRPVVIELHA